MIDMETVGFIGVLNCLAHESVKGIKPFSAADYDNSEGLFYDDSSPIEKNDEYAYYPLVQRFNVGLMKHEIMSTYTDEYKKDGIAIYAVVSKDSDTYVCVTLSSDEIYIVVEDGIWYDAK